MTNDEQIPEVTNWEIMEELKQLRAEHKETITRVQILVDKAMPHIEAMGPMIEGLANNPMFKMLAGGKKK